MAAVEARGDRVGESDRAKLERLFDDTRKRLVETGTRNRLVHVNRANTRGNVLNLVNERSDDVHRILCEHRAMRFRALGRDRDDDGETKLADAGQDGFSDERYVDAQLETRLGPDALARKLLKMAREAATAEEEQGVNILYLALGFLTWFEDASSNVPREAPLVLLPVELVRNHRTSTYDLRVRDEDLLTNLPLQQRLREDFGIDLPEIEVGEGWSPSTYFDEVAPMIEARKGWRIERDAIQLGFFSFSKLLMYLDLALDAWPDGALGSHALTRGLLYEGFEREAPLFGPEDRLDAVLPPEKLFHVVDADASQARVIEEVRSGRNLVVQGPPGTGKSQTITNIIAAAVAQGQRVLFVAEKMAALSVVHERLVKVGLRDVCLELHSRSANKKVVLAELARTIAAAQTVPAAPAAPTALRSARDELNAIDEALHLPIGTSGETPFSVLARQARYIGAGAPPPRIAADKLAALTREEERALLDALSRYAALAGGSGGGPHPLDRVRNLDLQPVDLARLEALLDRAAIAASALGTVLRDRLASTGCDLPVRAETVAALADLLDRLRGLPADAGPLAAAILAGPDPAALRDAVRAGLAWCEAHDGAAGTFTEAALQGPVAISRGALIAGANSFFARWGRAYRQASRDLAAVLREPLPRSAAERVALVDRLEEVAAARTEWEAHRDAGARALRDEWLGERTDFARVAAVAEWCARVRGGVRADVRAMVDLAGRADDLSVAQFGLAETGARHDEAMAALAPLELDGAAFPGGAPERTDLDALAGDLAAMARAAPAFANWAARERLRRQLVEAGLTELVDGMRSGALNVAAAATELRFARAERLWRVALERSLVLRALGNEQRHEVVARFTGLERSRLRENVTGLLAGHLAQVPQGAQGEMGIIRGEIGKKSRHMALRRLFGRAGTAIQRIKPVLLMSPISVAQFLPPGSLSFDLLVIDEASQVRPEDALGAIARASQVVVVGDQKQLPPSSFFDRLVADDEEADADEDGEDPLGGAARVGDMESILTLCEARGLGCRMLKWHYRSRDPSLIAVSNREFYEDGLVLPPSPFQEDPAYGLRFTRVDGAYDGGKAGKRDNRREGEAIVARIAEHARAHPTLSLGVVTFSFAQRNLVNELLELARRTDTVLDDFLREGRSEDAFVKNIENVQGDERDVILVSVGYGPATPGGRLASMSFGPVNGEGGERRLNVLFTRARVRCEVFASFDPGDIDPTRAKGDGPRILKRFLEFAKSGRMDEAAPTGEAADSPFEEDVADVVRSLGFLADPQVGSSGFRIDMGVRHPDRPGTYLLAIECDGATYHSALWARERDRLRQDVLEHLGWRFHRIWSTDWFYRRGAEIERLKVALAEARDAAEAGIVVEGANQARVTPPLPAEPTAPVELPEAVARRMPAYERAVFPTRSWQEPHEVPVGTLAELVSRIVRAEGPIHSEEVARRVAASYGRERAGSRILAATSSALEAARRRVDDILVDGAFWFTRAQAGAPPIRDRSAESAPTIKAACISMLEIEAALQLARDDNAGGDDAELVRTAARLLGFKRVGADLQARIALGLRPRA